VFEVWNSSDDRRYGFTMLISGAGAVHEGPIICQPERDFFFCAVVSPIRCLEGIHKASASHHGEGDYCAWCCCEDDLFLCDGRNCGRLVPESAEC